MLDHIQPNYIIFLLLFNILYPTIVLIFKLDMVLVEYNQITIFENNLKEWVFKCWCLFWALRIIYIMLYFRR